MTTTTGCGRFERQISLTVHNYIVLAICVGLPMNKVQVGSAPSPNLKVVRSKVGSLQNTSHKPGGGQVKIENRKLEWKAGTRVEAKNDAYVPGGGDKKVIIIIILCIISMRHEIRLNSIIGAYIFCKVDIPRMC